MIIDAKLIGRDDKPGAKPGEAPSAADRIDADRLVWDLEYRRRIRELLKTHEAKREVERRRGDTESTE